MRGPQVRWVLSILDSACCWEKGGEDSRREFGKSGIKRLATSPDHPYSTMTHTYLPTQPTSTSGRGSLLIARSAMLVLPWDGRRWAGYGGRVSGWKGAVVPVAALDVVVPI